MGAITQGAWIKLRSRVTCPRCWASFAPEEVVWVSSDPNLCDSPGLSDIHPGRFLPERFDAAGNALDASGRPCRNIACPRCYGTIPRTLLEAASLHVSLVGERSERRALLAMMTARLRQRLPRDFAVDWQDFADREAEAGSPQLATLVPGEGHPHFSRRQQLARVLSLHDCELPAGEESARVATSSTVAPLAHSPVICYCFNPTRHAAFGGTSTEPAAEVNLALLARQLRLVQRIEPGKKSPSSLVIVVTQSDCWWPRLGDRPQGEPLTDLHALPMKRLAHESHRLRTLLAEHLPALVREAEKLAEQVIYLPAGELNRASEASSAASWNEMPLLYALAKWGGGLIACTLPSKARKPGRAAIQQQAKIEAKSLQSLSQFITTTF